MTIHPYMDNKPQPSGASVLVHENALTIYTDGSSYKSPRSGGMGFRFVYMDENKQEVAEDISLVGRKGATNNQMELLACIEGLKEALEHPALPRMDRIVVRTDSRYVTENWSKAVFEWHQNHWTRQSGAPVLNAELWKEFRRIYMKCKQQHRKRVDIEWVKGHKKDPHNKAADKLAKQSAKGHLARPVSVVAVRRKKSKEQVLLGSIAMRGQTEDIRIVSAEYLRLPRVHRYMYEVIAGASADCGKVDVACSEIDLRGAHHYRVVFNSDMDNPRIEQLIEELER